MADDARRYDNLARTIGDLRRDLEGLRATTLNRLSTHTHTVLGTVDPTYVSGKPKVTLDGTSVLIGDSGGTITTPGPPSVPVGQTQNFADSFATGVSLWSSVQEHTYDAAASGYTLGGSYRMNVINLDADRPHVLRTEVRDGDTAVGTDERCEISSFGRAPQLADEGDEKWYEFDIRLGDPTWAPSWSSSDDWLIVMQWHQAVADGSPPLALSVHSDNVVYFEREADDVIQSFMPVWTVRPGQWEHVVIHVKWSVNPAVGFVEAYVNGSLAVPQTPCQTLYTGDATDTFLKVGQYRRVTVGGPTVVMHDNLRISTLPVTDTTSVGSVTPGDGVGLDYVASYTPTANDRVALTLVQGKYVILGKVI